MAKNSNLSQAKAAKNDEFYTQYADIQKEVNAYHEYNPDVFRGKTILPIGGIRIVEQTKKKYGKINKKVAHVTDF